MPTPRVDLKTWLADFDLAFASLSAFSCEDLTALIESPDGPFGQAMISATAALSYWHTNGFFKLVLHRDTTTRRAVRMHVWPPQAFDSINIHNHKWYFTSKIMAGSLAEDRFELAPGTDWRVFDYDRTADQGTKNQQMTALTPLGVTGVVRLPNLTHNAGAVYDMPLHFFHRAQAGQHGAVTLVITDTPTTLGSSNVIAPLGELPYDIPPRRLSAAELTSVVSMARQVINTQPC